MEYTIDEWKREFSHLQETHLNVLTQHSMHALSTLGAGLELLRSDYREEIELSDTEKGEILEGLIDGVKQYTELVQSTLQERQAFINAKPSTE